jgi:cytochrome oxidase assembly protein ShyY1
MMKPKDQWGPADHLAYAIVWVGMISIVAAIVLLLCVYVYNLWY